MVRKGGKEGERGRERECGFGGGGESWERKGGKEVVGLRQDFKTAEGRGGRGGRGEKIWWEMSWRC